MKIPKYTGPDRYTRLVRFLERQFPLDGGEMALRTEQIVLPADFNLTTLDQNLFTFIAPRTGIYVVLAGVFFNGTAAGWGGARARCQSHAVFFGADAYLAEGGPSKGIAFMAWFTDVNQGEGFHLYLKKDVAAGTVVYDQSESQAMILGPFGEAR
jgi:hypothetical protein